MTRSRKRLEARGNLLTSLILISPLLLLYEIGVLFTDVMNGADFITLSLLRLVGLKGFLAIQAGIVLTVLMLALHLRRRQRFDPRIFVPVLLESGIYALTMGTVIVFLMVDLLHIDPRLAAAPRGGGVLEKLVMSVGAGVHEELVFRLLLLGGLTALLDRGLKLRRGLALVIAFAASSLIFSAAHHLGPLGEPLRMGVFVYRAIAGLCFGLLFQLRGLAIAVYTHALYDIYVLILH